MTPFVHDLVIARGARFQACAWVLRGDDGLPVRFCPPGLQVLAPVRRWAADPDVLAHLPCSVQAVTFADQYDGTPVVVAQLDEMGPAETAALGFERGVWSMTVSGERVGGGRVAAPVAR